MRKMHTSRRCLMTIAVSAAALVAGQFAGTVAAQDTATVDEAVEKILTKAVDAMGGKDKLDKINSSKVVMAAESPMGATDMTVYWKKPNMSYMVMDIPNMGEMKSGSNGEVAWTHNSMTGYTLTDPETMQNQGFADMVNQLKKTYNPLEAAGEEEFNGKPCNKLRGVTKGPDGSEQEAFIYFDQKTGLMAGQKTSFDMQGQTMESTTTFEDYKEVDGVMVPMKMVSSQMGMTNTMTIKEVEFNKVEDSRFSLPDEVKKMAAEQGDGG